MIKPLGTNVIVLKDPAKETTEGGIIIPEICERTPRFGPTVLATVHGVGAKCQHVKVGDRVALKAVAGDDIIHEGEIYTHCREKDLVGLASHA